MSLYQVTSSSPLQCSSACMKTNVTDNTLDVPCNHTGMTSQAVSHVVAKTRKASTTCAKDDDIV